MLGGREQAPKGGSLSDVGLSDEANLLSYGKSGGAD